MTRRQLARNHVEAQRRIQTTTSAKALRIWRNLGSWNEEDIPVWLQQIIPAVRGGQQQAVTLADAYIARYMGRRPFGLPADELSGQAVRPVAPEDEWRRPFVTLWAGLAEGQSFDAAFESAANRLDAMVQADCQLSQRAAIREIGLRDNGIYGWQRVTNAGACDLCKIASTQRYHVEHLMPIHDRCGCSVAPITEPTGQIINRDLYQHLRDERVGVRVEEHGELGPTLTSAPKASVLDEMNLPRTPDGNIDKAEALNIKTVDTPDGPKVRVSDMTAAERLAAGNPDTEFISPGKAKKARKKVLQDEGVLAGGKKKVGLVSVNIGS